jgi:hypothetical protein
VSIIQTVTSVQDKHSVVHAGARRHFHRVSRSQFPWIARIATGFAGELFKRPA